MKKRFSIIFLALVILFASTTDVHASRYEFFRDVARAVSRKNLDNIETGGFEIKNYEVNSVVGKDHSINVTETISVNFLERRHGLVRYIPYIMAASRTDKNGKVKDYKYRTMISNIEVNNEAYRIEVHDDYFYIFIGDKDKIITGPKTYTLNYTIYVPDDRVTRDDLFYYSVLGRGWGTTIENFKFKVTLPQPLNAEELKNLKLYSGSAGSETNELGVKYNFTSDEISGEASDLPVYGAITIYAPLREGYFVGEKSTKEEILVIMLALAVALALLFILAGLFRRKKKPVPVVSFHPPEGFSSAEVGMAIDGVADDIDLMSLVPYWASKGYIQINIIPDFEGRKNKHSKIELEKLHDLPSNAPTYQKTMFYALFENGDVRLHKLPESFMRSFVYAKDSLAYRFTGKRSLRTGYGFAFVFLSIILLLYGGSILLSSEIYLFDNLYPALAITIPLFIVGIWRIFDSGKDKNRSRRSQAIHIAINAMLLSVSIGFHYKLWKDNQVNIFIWLGVFVIIAIACLTASRLIVYTEYGLKVVGQLLGFREFIEKGEKDRLLFLMNENPDYYYECLPYALVFDLADEWADKFEGYLLNAPSWYSTYDTDDNPITALSFTYFMKYAVVDSLVNLKREYELGKVMDVAGAAATGVATGAGGGAGGGGGASW